MNLTEQWKKAYAEYLIEEEERLNADLDSFFEDLSNAHNEAQRGFKLVEDYFELFAESQGLNEVLIGQAHVGNHNLNGDEDKRENSDDKKEDETARKAATNASDVFKSIIGLYNSDSSVRDFAPTALYSVEKVSDMKFPQNVIFFIKALGGWIVKVVIYFIERVKNIIRRLIGDHDTANAVSKKFELPQLDLSKVKKIESISTAMSVGKPSDVIRLGKVDSKALLTEGLGDIVFKDNRTELEHL